MKQDQSLVERINGILSDEFEIDISRMQSEANLRQILELDSLDFIDLVVVLENNFSFKVKPEDFNRIYTFGDFYSYIYSRAQTKESGDAILAG